MRIAVVTPYTDEPAEWLARGHASLAGQGHEVAHILVADGRPDPAVAAWADQHIVLRHPHRDGGNAARMAGGRLSAASQRFDAVTFLDAADWFLPGHLAGMATVLQAAGADAPRRRAACCTASTAPRSGSAPGSTGCARSMPAASCCARRPSPRSRCGAWRRPLWVAGDAAQSLLGYLQGRERRVAVAGPAATVAKRVRARGFNAEFGPTPWDASNT